MRRLSLLLCAASLFAAEPETGKGLKIHEWGVFVAGRQTLVTGGGAPLDFMRPVLLPALPPLPPPWGMGPGLPVLHVYASKPTDLRVDVTFSSGLPTLAWPMPAVEMTPNPGTIALLKNPCAEVPARLPTLVWRLRTGLKDGPEPPKVPDGHWISEARKVGASRLLMTEGKEAEDFLFYEGRLGETSRMEVTRKPEGWMLPSGAPAKDAWLIESRTEEGKTVLDLCSFGDLSAERGGSPAYYEARNVNEAALKEEIAAALLRSGLTKLEAALLLGVWMKDFLKPGKRLLYLLPRSEYDRLLPLTVTPQPEEVARVGLVLKEIGS